MRKVDRCVVFHLGSGLWGNSNSYHAGQLPLEWEPFITTSTLKYRSFPEQFFPKWEVTLRGSPLQVGG